jgi:Tfp pilus assembly protein PilO
MDVNPNLVWQIIVSVAIAPLAYFIKTALERLRQIENSLSATREQMAEKYATKADVHADIGRVLDRLDNLDKKLDRLLIGKDR